ncbi:MAG: NUDIX domain-containing protein [Candidatus Paceibacterota bacterium]|jgi:8-oxo-dGTP diphosphatase|nr:NUDIX domain-containing protein [Candidatus Paceibacterota bacterium]
MKHKKHIIASPEHLRFAVLATDIAIFTVRDKKLLVRLIPVDRPPYFTDIKGLPGGLIDPKETAEEAALRHTKDKARIDPKKVHFEQLYTFSSLPRDPRGRVVAVAYIGLVPWEKLSASEQADSEEAFWFPTISKETLAYDHNEILDMAIKRLRSKIAYTTMAKKILPDEFTLTEMEETYESILLSDLDKRNFRKKILKLKIVTPLKRKKEGGAHRPAELYRFTSEKIKEIEVL